MKDSEFEILYFSKEKIEKEKITTQKFKIK